MAKVKKEKKVGTLDHKGQEPPRTDSQLAEGEFLTTNQGLRVSDNHNSLKAGVRGPTLLEDFVLREKITSFDHERIPERAVHARGAGAFGFFECTKNMSKFTTAGFLGESGKKTPVLVRFSTVAGSRGSADTVRDARGFATKFYTDEGNYDLVGNNIPVFFIQDAMKFPDLVHAVKPEPHNEIPQASSAHDTFWDFISLMPESTHMVFWLMSDRGIPRSFRMMEGFGVHSFRFVNIKGEGTFVKFHWKPKLGTHGLVWEEAQLLAGLDADFHRRDLYDAIDNGSFPEWELGVQLIPEADENKFSFDLLDPTKLVPEELVPVTVVGRMILNRNPDNFFSEIEQAVFHPGHLVSGIDLTNDPLLQGRLFSYTDTQITRLGGPNFAELPVNRPLAAVNNQQQDGFGRQAIPKGRVAYEPNSLADGYPLHAPEKEKTFVHFTERMEGHKIRARSESFGDHFSQAKLFYASQSKPEKDHIRKAFTFELSKVATEQIRLRMLQTLILVDKNLATAIADGLGMKAPAQGIEQPSAANPDNNLIPKNRATAIAQEDDKNIDRPAKSKIVGLPAASSALSMVLTASKSVATRKVAFLVTDKTPASEIKSLRKGIEDAGAVVELIAPMLGELKLSAERKTKEVTRTVVELIAPMHGEVKLSADKIKIDKALFSTPSVAYDGVIALAAPDAYNNPEDLGHALKFVAQAFKHCKTVGTNSDGQALLDAATSGLAKKSVPGLVNPTGSAKSADWGPEFLTQLAQHRHWEREDLVKGMPA